MKYPFSKAVASAIIGTVATLNVSTVFAAALPPANGGLPPLHDEAHSGTAVTPHRRFSNDDEAATSSTTTKPAGGDDQVIIGMNPAQRPHQRYLTQVQRHQRLRVAQIRRGEHVAEETEEELRVKQCAAFFAFHQHNYGEH